MKVYFDKEPQPIERIGNTYRFRYNIKRNNTGVGSYCADEVEIFTLTANSITRAVIEDLCPKDREQKLINEFNEANLGLIGRDKTNAIANARIEAYKSFLVQRAELKSYVDEFCKANNIE